MINVNDIPEMESDLKKVNQHMERLCHSNHASMQNMMDWILSARGKQLRPILTLLCSKLKGKRIDATEIAAVIEICHTASLIHDDIIDEADIRRGELSLQKKFGKEMAVYAGDFMIFSTIGRTSLMNKPWYKKMFEKLEIMCDGEVGQFDSQFNTSITEHIYLDNIIGKTSSMFEIACGAGAYEGKCSTNERESVQAFARNFGLLFQIRDDLMDFISSQDISKKTIHNDFWCGYYTLPAIHTFENPAYGDPLKEIAKQLQFHNQDSDVDSHITELIENAGGFEYTLEKIHTYANEARLSLKNFPNSNAKQKLLELIDYLQFTIDELCSERTTVINT